MINKRTICITICINLYTAGFVWKKKKKPVGFQRFVFHSSSACWVQQHQKMLKLSHYLWLGYTQKHKENKRVISLRTSGIIHSFLWLGTDWVPPDPLVNQCPIVSIYKMHQNATSHVQTHRWPHLVVRDSIHWYEQVMFMWSSNAVIWVSSCCIPLPAYIAVQWCRSNTK